MQVRRTRLQHPAAPASPGAATRPATRPREQRAVAQHLWFSLEVGEQRLEVFQVEQQQPFAIRHLEGRKERRLLTIGQLQQIAEQQRPHFAQRSTQGMAATTMYVPQGDRVRLRTMIEPGHAGDPLGDLALRRARGAQPAQVTLDVRGEDRDPGIAELLGQPLQGHRLSGAGGAGDQAMPIGKTQDCTLGSPLASAPAADDRSMRASVSPNRQLLFRFAFAIFGVA